MNLFKVGDKVRLKNNEDNRRIEWDNLNYTDVYEVEKSEKEFIQLKECFIWLSPDRFELAKKREEYLLVYYKKNRGVRTHFILDLSNIIGWLNYSKPEKENIQLFRKGESGDYFLIPPIDWPFTTKEITQTIFKEK